MLTPKQAVIAWLVEAQRQHPTLVDYVVSLAGQPITAFPLLAIPRQLDAGIPLATNKQSRAARAEASRLRVRDVGFLVDLVVETNRAVVTELPVRWALLALLSEQQRPALTGWETWARPRAELWAGQMAGLAMQILSRSFAIELIADRYFAGYTPTFPATAEELAELRIGVEEMVALFNDGLSFGFFGPEEPEGCEPLQINFEQLVAAARQMAGPLVELLVRLAQAEALALVGERGRALEVLSTYLVSQTAAVPGRRD